MNACHVFSLQEYLGIAGNPDFCKLSAKLAFGANSKAIKEGRAATVQSLSGTGSLRVSMSLLCINVHSACTAWPLWAGPSRIINRLMWSFELCTRQTVACSGD